MSVIHIIGGWMYALNLLYYFMALACTRMP